MKFHRAEHISERGKQNERSARKHVLKNAACGEAVHRGHRKVENYHISCNLLSLGDRLFAVRGFGGYGPTCILEDLPQGSPDHGAIVDEENTFQN